MNTSIIDESTDKYLELDEPTAINEVNRCPTKIREIYSSNSSVAYKSTTQMGVRL